MSTNGQLVFTDVDKITFKGVGNTSNAVVDTVTGKIGVGTDNPDANLHVLGNSYVSTNLELGGTLIMGTVNVSAHHSLEAVTAEGNTTPLTVEFQNADTSLVASGNVVVNGNVLFTSNVTTSVDSNVVVEHKGPHGRGTSLLKKYPEIAFAEGKFDANESTNTYVQAGYTVTASSQFSGYHSWEAFDEITGNGTQYWSGSTVKYATTGDYGFLPGNAVAPYLTTVSDTVYNGEWIQLELPHKLKLSYVTFFPRLTNRFPRQGVIAGSNDGTNWDAIHIFSGLTTTIETDVRITTDSENNTTAYKYIRLVITHLNGNEYAGADNIKLYGYEEDPPAGDSSLDTTFTSVMNTPQTTGANVYVDAKLSTDFTNQVTGPTPTGTAATHNDTGKYWELTGALTSNVTVEANTFLEGDAPHSVSVWFNSSNLEANVSNTCVFSIASEEKLDSVNLDLQSNTWHNLTYSYQGEGGSRVTYLDGRKVAEDQAEDTFGEYPPFAMTGYSQGGYVVSASDENATWPLWRIFAGDADFYVSSTSAFPGGVYTSGSTYNLGTNSGGSGTDNGHWIKLAVPYKLKISHVNIDARTGYVSQAPKNFKFYGSNDDTNWEQIGPSFSNEAPQDDGTSYYTLNSTKAYKYIGLVVTETVGDGNGRLGLQQLKLYGHRENDLVRLPDPTRVLKYPHIAMTGPAQRGYVASASSFYNSGTEPEHGFDGVLTSSGLNHTWESGPRTGSGNGRYTSGSTFNTSYLNEVPPLGEGGFQTTESSNTWTGEWLQIELPHSINTTKYVFGNADGNSQWNDRIPTSGVILGSTNGSTWNFIHQSSSTLKDQTLTISHTGYYKYFRLIGTTVGGTQTIMLIPEWELYGTGVDSVPIQIGGGNIDRVANFRVYDKFIEEDQALEIWDAQKDEFGRVKSSMTLQKGRLGIGTDEPEGRLPVLDEPHNLEEFPLRAMTGYETYMEGHGVFKVNGSGAFTTSPRLTWKAFNKSSENIDDGWMPDSFVYDATSSGTATGTTPTYNGSASLGGIGGEWISLEFPYKVKINRLKITSYHVGGSFRGLNDGFLLGRGDKNSEWTRVHEITNLYTVYGVRDADQLSAEISFTNDDYYNEYALIATSTTGETLWTAMELKYFGTREQRQSVLHDGQLTLTKNLTVPRIGPALDADDTPRRDRLVVEYNTSSNPTFEGAVRDTSGRGNDGMLLESARYDASDKAFVFDGAGGPIERRDFREFK